jgi:hypothetical protein
LFGVVLGLDPLSLGLLFSLNPYALLFGVVLGLDPLSLSLLFSLNP